MYVSFCETWDPAPPAPRLLPRRLKDQVFALFGGRNPDVKEFPRGSFAGLRNLGWLIMGSCGVTVLRKGVFLGLSKLTNLEVDRNLIARIELGVFDDTPSLDIVDLSLNALTELPVGIFKHNHRLTSFSLDANPLRRLAPSLAASAHIEQVSISYNEFRSLADLGMTGQHRHHRHHRRAAPHAPPLHARRNAALLPLAGLRAARAWAAAARENDLILRPQQKWH